MNEFLMQLLKELEKNLHRSNVRSVGMGISQQIWAEKRLTDQNHQMTAEEAAQEFSRCKLLNTIYSEKGSCDKIFVAAPFNSD